jgi:hypothetical protein
MATPPLSRELAQQAVDAMSYALNAGKSGRFASRMLGLANGTFVERIQTARRLYGLEPAAPLPPVQAVEVPEIVPERVRVRVKAARSVDDAPVYRVLAVGDAHDAPSLPDKSRFRWIARHAVETKPDQIVQIGDFASFDCLSRHALPGTLSQKLRPSFAHEMESLEEALNAMHGVFGTDMQLHVTLGNHETRIQKYELSTAELEGTLWQPVLDLFARYGWRTHDEGAFHFVGGVGFVHAPRTLMGREYGGKTLNAIANDAMFSIVFGHSHRKQILSVPKIGPLAGVDIINLGTCMPTGHVEPYARVSMTGWTYGVMLLTIQNGRVIGHDFTSMEALRERYA